jgi:2-methylisocitrate lyase-like PEP mutase family enzyme
MLGQIGTVYDFDRMLSLAKHITDFVCVPIYSDRTGGFVKT